ncbi:MAG: hypothetical protein HY552_03115 [Elusimicrobia bacterium]|nr:hypothetical protein [Elusimicrobiota bacterium]
MDAAAPPTEKPRRLSALVLAAAAAGLAAGLGAGALVWRLRLEPRYEAALRRYETVQDVMALYGLQERYKRAWGVYADGLDALLSIAPDGPALRARMAGHLDLATLAVVGGADRFKIEANALDGERTLVRVRGPVAQAPPARR